jgi:hypothetical protein
MKGLRQPPPVVAQGAEHGMSNLVGDILRPIGDVFTVPLTLALCLVTVAALTRTGSFMWYLLQRRGPHPLVMRMGTGSEDGSRERRHAALDGKLLAYLAADSRGDYVIAPGAGGSAAPGVTAEALKSGDGWVPAMLRLGIAREPSYQVEVAWPGSDDAPADRKAVARITRTPGDRIVASGSFAGKGDQGLVEAVGCFCITFLRRQPRMLRHTPRWERWGQDINGYRAYRSGLEYQRLGISDTSHQDYSLALEHFSQAARIEPANLLVQLHRAALLELTHDYEKAIDIYDKCRSLWPEHIETGYRIGNARKNVPGRFTHEELQSQLSTLKVQLRWRSLLKCWLLTFRPSRWNPGERRYWRSWLHPQVFSRVSKRAGYLHAVTMSELLAGLSCLLNREVRCACGSSAEQLMNRLAAELLRRPKAPVLVRLLHPDQRQWQISQHDHAWHVKAASNVSLIPAYQGREHRSDIGWLALFNSACFFSLAIKLGPDQLPGSFTDPGDWADDCARAAIRELGVLVRHPQHTLDPDWLVTDPDLDPVRDSPVGRAWANFVGLPIRASAVAPISDDQRPPAPRPGRETIASA